MLLKIITTLFILSYCFCLNVSDGTTLLNLGENLKRRLSVYPSGNGDDLINDLTDYYIYLNNALRVPSKSNPEGHRVVAILKVHGGPPHLKTTLQDEFIRQSYNYSEVEMDHFHDIMQDTKQVWRELNAAG